jgi:hypothetical protein
MISAFPQKSMVNVRQFSDPRHRNSHSKGLGRSHTGGLMESIVSAPGLD